MFETPREIKPSASKGLWMGIAVVVLVGAAGAYSFLMLRGSKRATVATSAVAKNPADPVRDLKILRATMNKDRNGTMAVWVVTLENKSNAYSYSDIKYETSYVGADNTALLINQGTIATTISPGEQKNSQVNDALYPAGTAWYKLKITGATAVAQ